MKKFFWNLTWLILRPLLNFFCHFEINGIENIKKIDSNFIIALAIHANYADPFIAGSAFPFNCRCFPIRYMTAKKFIEMPIIGKILKSYGAFPVERQSELPIEEVVKEAVFLLENRETLGIFIEGRLSKDGNLGELKLGAAYLSLKTNIPILPMALSGTFGLNFINFFLRRKKIIISFDELIYPKKIDLPDKSNFISKENTLYLTNIIAKKLKNYFN